uniref:Uncharacterized protein n=1 Tax=Moniliophthora roreri TaxID=221103 RepID=A0A0W0FH59_MONRR
MKTQSTQEYYVTSTSQSDSHRSSSAQSSIATDAVSSILPSQITFSGPAPSSSITVLSPTPQTNPGTQPGCVSGKVVAYPNISVDCITMSLSGILFSYNLNNLKSDPHEITELLRATSSEYGNWIVVGAFYRRKGLPHAAISVIQTMLQGLASSGSHQHLLNLFPLVMAQRQIPEEDLKPAYLLLCGCETDLAKKTRHDHPLSAVHQEKSIKWLRKVYGDFKSTSVPPLPSKVPTVECSTAPRASSTGGSTPSASHGHDQAMEQEIQSLRDNLNHQMSLLASLRASKRKLEDEFDAERSIRLKLEHQVDDFKRDRLRGIPWHAEMPYYRY